MTLLNIAEGILDSDACSEILEEGIEGVILYAENGCGLYLNLAQADRILNVCKNWTENGHGTNDYYYNVIRALREY